MPANQSGQLAPELRVQNFVGQDIRRRSRHQTDKAKEAAGFGRLVFVVVFLPAATLQKRRRVSAGSLRVSVFVMDEEDVAAGRWRRRRRRRRHIFKYF